MNEFDRITSKKRESREKKKKVLLVRNCYVYNYYFSFSSFDFILSKS